MRTLQTTALIVLFALAARPAVSQDAATPATPAPPAAGATPLKVVVAISRYQGEKKVSSLPYTLSMNATSDTRNAGRANLRMGAKIPVPVTTLAPAGAPGQPQAMMSWNYENVGTNIDCTALTLDGGRFRVDITIEDTSVYSEDQGGAGAVKGTPSFRSFRASDQMVLKDGATSQFTAATDKVSGEVVRVDVTLTVVK